MATLKNKHKTFIVIRLACFESPEEVQDAFGRRYGFKPSPSQISYYNPSNIESSKKLGEQWKKLFKETRERYGREISEVPISNQRYRLEKLQNNLLRLEKMKNYKAANETIEQAAKEVGGAFTNKTELTGKDGGPIETDSNVVFYLPDNGRDSEK